jgi:hypothetical protein
MGKPAAATTLNEFVAGGAEHRIGILPLAYEREKSVVADSLNRSQLQPAFEGTGR